MADDLARALARIESAVGDRAEGWDLAGLIPQPLLRELGAEGLLCAQLPQRFGGLGMSSLQNGELTAGTGALCSSLRSVQTSQGMAGWTIARFGLPDQERAWLPGLTSGQLAAVAFSEPGAGSDLSAMSTTVRADGDRLVLDGRKKWITAARYADLLVVFGRYEDGAAAVVVPTDTPGVRIRPIADPLGCRAAGHCDIELDGVRVPAGNLLGGAALPLPLLVTTALSYGRMSVAWGCVGILRACLRAAAGHAARREQFGRPIGEHQLVAGHLADLLVAERTATRICEHASRCWDSGSAEQVVATVLAKQVSAEQAARAAATAVQVLASAGASDGTVVARAYRDAKLMEIIEGSSELCRLLLAEHVLASYGREER
ncbi:MULTISPECIES: acyl-CoA dehydrogenase family protein [unclassified Streptomyces]|uniref:acyl-CoA dehydrogenase family protein n=1 Tax=Streptomycetaceae TaxID=2062 RepID=UPI002E763ACD|nr:MULTISPECIES: acyl-CoA dehydrogenase family protein [unclassified Streptomyces]MED7954012.1 acyl-CoA/acyl-ACP dehydrogenase [Streptomyces sp. BE303]MEE1821139.1 acyl-CoA/acyl-ACP dehydrogenase [Streptomyces sp. BE20]